jgi:hypothetical protein
VEVMKETEEETGTDLTIEAQREEAKDVACLETTGAMIVVSRTEKNQDVPAETTVLQEILINVEARMTVGGNFTFFFTLTWLFQLTS